MVEIQIDIDTIQLLKMDDSTYFSEKYKDYISNSKLSLINPEEGGSFDKFENGFDSKYSASYELGSAVHNMVLQPEYYYISDIRKPSAKLGLFAEEFFKLRSSGLSINDSINKASINSDYYAGKLTDNRIKTAIKSSIDYYFKKKKEVFTEENKEAVYLSDQMFEKYEQCINGINQNKELLNLLRPEGLLEAPESFNEYAILCEADVNIDGEISRIKLKAKLDNFTLDHEQNLVTLNDLKTTGKPVRFFMGNDVYIEEEKRKVWYDGSFQKYRYYRQMGMYLWLLQCAVQKEYGLIYTSKANMLVVETIPNFSSKVYAVNGIEIRKGLQEFKKLITLVVQWKKNQ